MTKDHRQFIRLPSHSTAFVEYVSSGPGPSQTGRVIKCHTVDVSRRGLRLTLDQALPEGAILQMGIDLAGLNDTLYLTGEVTWCRADKSNRKTWLAGFRLIDAAQSDIDHWQRLLSAVAEPGNQ